MGKLYLLIQLALISGAGMCQGLPQPAPEWIGPKPDFLTKPMIFEHDTTHLVATELDKRYGFLGNRFGTSLSAFKGLIYVENSNGWQVYKKPKEIHAIGEATISRVRYLFYKGKLSGVRVYCPNTLKNEDAWRELLKTAYGPAQDSIESLEADDAEAGVYGGSYLWIGERAGINYSDYLGREISIYVLSFEYINMREEDKMKLLRQNAKKL